MTVDGKNVTLGRGHIGLGSALDGSGTTDNMLYLWLTKADHEVTADGRSVTLHWDAATSSFGIAGPADVFSLTLGADSLQVMTGGAMAPDKRVTASVYDAAGKMLASASSGGKPAMTLPFSGVSFRLRLLETAQDWKPLSDYAYTVRYSN